MDMIVTTALVGTGQQSSPDIATGTEIDTLGAQLAGEDVERRILLTAGALAFYRQAGQIAAPAPALPERAAPEMLHSCSVKVAQILTNLLQGEHNDLLPEAYTLLEKAHRRLPFELLPLALVQGTRNPGIRAHVLPILGERGYWLCQFNTAWSWVNQLRLETQRILLADIETVWQEGSGEQRAEVLRRVRATDPSKALEWLKAVWKKEKVDVRTTFLSTLAIGLSMADQPFLEQALDDRGESVRREAAQLLTRLTTSPQALGLLARADELLQYENGKLSVILPASIEKVWMQDVTMLKSAENEPTSKSYWLHQALSRVPPAHWEECFSASPSQILIAVGESEWSSEVMNALAAAAILHMNTRWFSPLVDWYMQRAEASPGSNQDVSYYYALLSRLPQREAENRVRQQLARQDYSLQSARSLPTPWSDEFSTDCVQSLKDHYHAFNESQSSTDQWVSALNTAAVSLAPSCFDAALTGWNFFTDGNNYIHYWNAQLHTFLQKVGIRKSLIEEMR